MASEDALTAEERSAASYLRQRLAGCRAALLRDADAKPLHARLERAYTEGFMATLTNQFAEAHADLRDEWEAIREDFARLGRVNVTLAAIGDDELEALEARILAFVDRYMARTEHDR